MGETTEKLNRRIAEQRLIIAISTSLLENYEAQRVALEKAEDQPKEEEKKKARTH